MQKCENGFCFFFAGAPTAQKFAMNLLQASKHFFAWLFWLHALNYERNIRRAKAPFYATAIFLF